MREIEAARFCESEPFWLTRQSSFQIERRGCDLEDRKPSQAGSLTSSDGIARDDFS